jgi:hypothetical protein
MTYAELQAAIIEDSHRPDLASLVPRFIREGEGMIRRDLTAYLLTGELGEAARVTPGGPIYTLPDGVMVIRRLALQGQLSAEVARIALGAIGAYPLTARVATYAEPGDGTVIFRGAPPTDTIFDLNYYGMPAPLVAEDDTNALLDENESLYKSGALFFLYRNTQDRELASDSLDVFNGVISTLNEQVARKVGGAKITPSYNFSGGSSY